MIWTHAYYSTWAATARECPLYFHEADEDTIPAWSLHRLIEMLNIQMQTDGRYVYLAEGGFDDYASLYDNIIDCIDGLIQDKRFDEEYLI